MWHGATAEQPVIVDIVRRTYLAQYAGLAYQGLRAAQELFGPAARNARLKAEVEERLRQR